MATTFLQEASKRLWKAVETLLVAGPDARPGKERREPHFGAAASGETEAPGAGPSASTAGSRPEFLTGDWLTLTVLVDGRPYQGRLRIADARSQSGQIRDFVQQGPPALFALAEAGSEPGTYVLDGGRWTHPPRDDPGPSGTRVW
jgi:hypothetical protein